MRIVAALVCTLFFSLTLPSLSLARDYDDDIKGRFENDGGNQKGKGNCSEKGNCDKDKGNNKGSNKGSNNDNDYSVSCLEIDDRDLRRECLERRVN